MEQIIFENAALKKRFREALINEAQKSCRTTPLFNYGKSSESPNRY